MSLSRYSDVYSDHSKQRLDQNASSRTRLAAAHASSPHSTSWGLYASDYLNKSDLHTNWIRAGRLNEALDPNVIFLYFLKVFPSSQGHEYL